MDISLYWCRFCILEYGGIGLNTAKNGKNTWKKFGEQGSTRRTLWITWVRLDSLGLTLVYFGSLGFTGFTWVHLDQLKITWAHFDALGWTLACHVWPGLIWVYLALLGFTCHHLGSLGVTCDHFGSLALTGVHLGSLGCTLVHLGSLGCTWFDHIWSGRLEKQDQNSTYRCALKGLRIYNLFNLFSLPIWVTFIFEGHSNLSENPICLTFQFEWHSNLSDNLIWVTFHF